MWWKKYTAVMKTSFKEALAYRFDALSASLFSFLRIWLAWLLWKAVFGEKETVGGYTFPMMLTYYILITFFSRLARSESIIWETAEEVRKGTFTKYITRPINHFAYALSRSAAQGLFSFLSDTGAFLLWIVLFRNSFLPPAGVLATFQALLFALLGLLTTLQIHYHTALISFKTVDIAGPWFFVSNIMSFLSGALIPLALLPEGLRQIVSLTPFYYILYYPAALYLGQETGSVRSALIVVLAWNGILLVARKWRYRRMIRFYEGVGQ
ncbi:MAG: ABC-2 family transporter protein [Spirochaetales bacterium]|nr:ABC-2 family transporter protein [Spirochaetales bacterium]